MNEVEQGFQSVVDNEASQMSSDVAEGYSRLYKAQNDYFSEQKATLKSTTLLTALATMPNNTMTEKSLGNAKQLLDEGQEAIVRSKLADERMKRQLAGVGRLANETAIRTNPELFSKVQDSYSNIMSWDRDRKAKIAIEEEAVDRIKGMASSDPVQAKVLLDNLEYGTADQTNHDFNVKMSILSQRAEELDNKYQQSGWGRWLLNFGLNLIPLNYNFQRTGNVGTAGILDLLHVGTSQQRESNSLWQQSMTMSNEDFADFAASDGPLMQSIHDNATSIFDMFDDPGAAVEIMDSLITTDDSTKNWNNIWGGVEIATVVPWGKLGKASKALTGMGARREAVRNLANHVDTADLIGPEAASRATGLSEREVMDELSVTAATGVDDGTVPLATDVADRIKAARTAVDELFQAPEFARHFSAEELQANIEGRIKEITARIGSPVKDIAIVKTPLSGGQTATKLTFTLGKKDGGGAATESAMKRIIKYYGFEGDAFQDTVKGGIEPPKSDVRVHTRIKQSAENDVGVKEGEEFISFTVTTPDKNEVEGYLVLGKDGVGKLDINGLSVNELGPKEVRAIGARLADEIPELKTIKGTRVSGARMKTGKTGEMPDINAEKLRGKIVRDMSGQWFGKITVDMPEAGWLTGQLKPPEMGFMGRMLGRWFLPASRVSDTTLHGMALESGSYLNRAHKVIDNQVLGIYRKLGGKSREIVRQLAHRGAIEEKWYTPEQVHDFVERRWNRRATDQELNAYKDLRLFNDMDHVLRNDAVYLNKLARHQETVTFGTKWGEDFTDVDVKIDYTMDKLPVERVYDASRNKHYVHGRNPLSSKDLEVMNNNGYVMMTFDEGFNLPEGVVVNKVLIKKTDLTVKPLKREQLAYSEGGHRMYTSRVFVKQGRKGVQRDTKTEYLKSPNTFRTAENIADGRKWADKMNEVRLAYKKNPDLTTEELDEMFGNDPSFPTGEEFRNGVIDETYDLDHPFEAVFDREMPSMYNTAGVDVERMFNEDELGVNGYYRTTGRMYTSAKGEILRDTKGNIAEIMDPYDTLSKSLSNSTRQLGLFAYKINAIERFGKTYKDFLDLAPNARNPSQLLTDAKVIPSAPIALKNQIEAQRAAILNVLRFETPVERATRQMYQTTAEHVLGDGDSLARKLAHDAVWWWKDNNPVSIMRGLAFDMKLGMFNPGQLLVQASTMFSATAMSPKYGWFGMSGLYPMHAYILKGGSEAVLDAMTKRGTWKAMGFDSVDEFKEYARHAHQHGFMEMNGSHIMVNNFGPNAHFGSFAEKQQRAREQARVFFYTSEIWNRLVAYRIAWGETWDVGLRPNNPEFNANILRRADDYSFNMTNESAAFWQKGLLSLPTQFWAYNMRMMDAMFGKRFTPAQRARLIGLNLGIAGTAGVPGLQGLAEYIKQKHGAAPDIDTLGGIADRGLIDYLNYQATGNDVLIGERVGTGGWASDTVKSIFGASEYGEQSFADIVGGATWAIGKNTSKTLWNLGKYAAAESGSELDAGEITKDNIIDVFKEVSTFGNAAKAVMIYQHGILKSNSGTIVAANLPEGNAVYQALSFRPAKAEEISYMMSWRQDKKEAQQDFTKQLRNWRQEAIATGDYSKYWKKANILIQMIPYEDRREILQSVNQTQDQSFYDFVERKVSEEQTEAKMVEELK